MNNTDNNGGDVGTSANLLNGNDLSNSRDPEENVENNGLEFGPGANQLDVFDSIISTDREKKAEKELTALSENPEFPAYKFVFIIASIVLYIADSGLDLSLALSYYQAGFFNYFWLTVGFVVVPTIIVAIVSIFVYYLENEAENNPKPSNCHIILLWLFSVLSLGPVLRDFQRLVYFCKGRNALTSEIGWQHYRDMERNELVSAYLRLFERFLEAAPQVTLQAYIILHNVTKPNNPILDGTIQRISVAVACFSLALSLTVFNAASRRTDYEKHSLTTWGFGFQFTSNFFMISSRICSLAYFTAVCHLWIVPACAVHWFFMSSWLFYLDWKEYMNGIGEETSRTWRNWLSLSVSNQIEIIWAVGASYVLFGIGLCCMLCYFRWFHPAKRFLETKRGENRTNGFV